MQRKHNSRIYEHGTSNEEKQNKKDNDDLIDDVCQFTGSTSDAVRKSVEMEVNDPLSLVIPTFVWDFYFRGPFRLSDSFQLLCGISVLSPDFG